ncbi:MAG: cytochrome c peroxidase [Blastocatellia bacterium]|nr:cytochrome c peroxidase [Blastocatellia bacterium]
MADRDADASASASLSFFTRMLKRFLLIAFALFSIAEFAVRSRAAVSDPAKRAAVIRLGERLFRDERFSTSRGDLPASCSHCHLLDEDPQGLRAYADFFNRSWVSSRAQDRRRLELRNSPTILDAGEMPRLHFDGEFASLEDLVKGTLSGRPMGWLPGEEAEAFERVREVLLADAGRGGARPYREQFRQAFGVDLAKTNRDQAVDHVARAIADYMRTLRSRRDAPYDKFLAANRLDAAPAAKEKGADYGRRLLREIAARESSRSLKLTAGFDGAALQGMKLFFTTEGPGPAGNCVACHTPPLFTDQAFHNLGVSQREYDAVHGEGRFAALSIPSAAEARRPAPQYREIPSTAQPGQADLGHWNFADPKASPQRRADETDERFLQRMIGAFKTPTLRNLRYTYPYFHDGSVHSLRDLLSEMIWLSETARAGKIREADEELARIRLTDSEIDPLGAFLNALNEDLKRPPATARRR